MHPDQATEEIVDMGLKHNLRFAIVPCCVFAHQFPQRRILKRERILSDGQLELIEATSLTSDKEPFVKEEVIDDENIKTSFMEVKTYSELVEYLKGKDNRIKMDFLSIEGRNKILYFDPLET
eukprot:TRINITY_DN5589_c0_g1_i3.p1 TRINITY_DN5589_c0_g1~~TRINITY_DN5589_c0_g1_i3.p1  ORF type:complete len:122 (-),score=40.48 TRINITY_DN5589_c0_g1_i3:24-389(-)